MQSNCVTLIFSKDRALQLDATLSSFILHNTDPESSPIRILYTTTSETFSRQYHRLAQDYAEYKFIKFIREEDFYGDLLALLAPFDYVLFLVDDNIFVKDFSLSEVIENLQKHLDAIGFSLRLGKNTTYCYSLDKVQGLPAFQPVSQKILKYNWTAAEHDFGYPLEVSSSVYRTEDIISFIAQFAFKNPNTLELFIASNKSFFVQEKPYLLCYEKSVTFCAPLNLVQSEWTNRTSNNSAYSTDSLAQLFDQGYRVDIAAFNNFTPTACHQEVELKLVQPRSSDKTADLQKPGKNLVSVIIPCYNQADFLPEAVESVVNQTYQDWECIIVNDGSPDNTSEIARDLISKYPDKKIILLEKENGGLADARNFGIKNSRGEYILPLDSDDKIAASALQIFTHAMSENPHASFAYSDTQEFGESDAYQVKHKTDLQGIKYHNHWTYSTMFHKKMWGHIGGYKCCMVLGAEDWEFWINALENGFQGVVINKPLFYYHVRSGSMVTETESKIEIVRAQLQLLHPLIYSKDELNRASHILNNADKSFINKMKQQIKKTPTDKSTQFIINLLTQNKSSLKSIFSKYLPKISVILPTYNRSEILAKCLEGFANQTISKIDFEIIVVDDGSTPPVIDTVERFSDRLNIVYHYQENTGLAAARNACIERATAPLLALHDDDDIPAPDYLERCLKFHEEHPYEEDILLAQVVPYSELKRTPLLEWMFDAVNGIIGFPNPNMPHNFWKFYGGTSSCKRSLFNYGLYDPAYRFGFEDMELALRLNSKVHLRVHYDPHTISYLIRIPDFPSLFRRSYLEGRSHFRFYMAYGESALDGIGRTALQSDKIVASIESSIPEILANIKKYEHYGYDVPDTFTFEYHGLVHRGVSALRAFYSACVTYARSKGWVDHACDFDEPSGQAYIDNLLDQHYKPASAPFFINKNALSSAPKVDIVLPPGQHSWNVRGGWVNTIRNNATLGKVFDLENQNPSILLEYIVNPQSDIMLLPGFDHHMSFLHDTEQLREIWRSSKLFKILLAQETVLQDCYPNTKEMTASALSCIDMAVYNTASDEPFYKSHSTPAFWQPFGVDETVFINSIPFEQRQCKAYFRGKTKPIGLPHTYQRRRELLQILLAQGLVYYKEFDHDSGGKELIEEFNQYQIALNLPAVFQGFTTRVFESLACGCALVTPRPTHPMESSLFIDSTDLVFYSPENERELITRIRELSKDSTLSKEIAENGYNKVIQTHTLTTRWQQILGWTSTVYGNFTTNASHQEVELKLVQPRSSDKTADRQQTGKNLVSVIIPCYNQAHLLPEAVASVVNQTYQEWECIIVNDGSPDNTSEIARDLISKYPDKKIILLEKENGGLADARNFGIKHSGGEYILPLDSDDKVLPEMLQETVAVLSKYPDIAIAYTDTIRFDAVDDMYPTGDYDLKRLSLINILNYCSLFRRTAWESVGGYNTNMVWGYEDWEFWIACGKNGFYGKRIPKPLFMYRIKGDSMLTNAYKHDAELKAQIVLNNPQLYGPRTIQWAKSIMLKVYNNESDLQPPALLCIIPTDADLDKNGIMLRLPEAYQFKKLSVLHINTDDLAGGAAKVAWRLAEYQRKSGHSSKMLVKNKISDTGHSVSIPFDTDAALRERCYREGLLDYEFLKSHELINHPLVPSANVLHFHNLHGGYFSPFAISALSHLKPVVWTLHDMQSFTGHCALSFECERWQTGCGECPNLSIYPGITMDSTAQLWRDKKFIYDRSRLYIVTPSEWLKNKVKKSILKNHQIELIYNGIDPNVFRPYPKAEARKKFGLPVDRLLIGSRSNGGVFINSFKGGEYVLTAMEKMREQFPDCEFLNIGAEGDSGIPYIKNIPPVTDESELAQLYSALDIFLFTSLAENCPLVVLEAMACGVPVVSFSTGGVPELVRDGVEGLVVEYKDADALISSLVGLAFSPDLREQFGINARQRVCTSFDIKNISRQYEDLYMRIEEIEKQRHAKIDREVEKIQNIMEAGNNGQAHNFLTGAIKQYPDSPDLLNLQVELDVRSGNLEGAKAILLDLVKLWPRNYDFLSNLAILFWEAGDIESANKYFTDALRVSQFDRSLVLTYGEMLIGYGDFLKARKLYEIYLKIDPGDLEIQTLFQDTEKLSATT